MRIVYNSFHGRYCDSPRVIFERLRARSDLEHIWLQDAAHQSAFPVDVPAVDIDGRDAGAVVRSADLVVANTHTEIEWKKRAGTTYLQTWHGTPMKRIHHDVLWAPQGRLERLDRDVRKWDLLLSPNSVSTPLLRRAFRFEGPILQTGYPRNDVLSSVEADTVRRQTRKELGIADDQYVVFYAPTWRDDECFQDSQPIVPLAVDLAAFAAALGKDCLLLVRLHNMMTGRALVPDVAGVRDVSYYPDVSELYLAADVLVTDYSSAMFDFANTGKPIVFYTYDLDRFRDSVRGFYFDLTPEAPGPTVHTVEDLLAAIRALPGSASQYVDRYRLFKQTYCHLEDGRATDRVITHLPL